MDTKIEVFNTETLEAVKIFGLRLTTGIQRSTDIKNNTDAPFYSVMFNEKSTLIVVLFDSEKYSIFREIAYSKILQKYSMEMLTYDEPQNNVHL